MFNNTGFIIKVLAIIYLVIGILASLILGICAWSMEWLFDDAGFLAFLIFIIGGFIVFYLPAMCIYGFGELIDNVQEINFNTAHKNSDEGKKLSLNNVKNSWMCNKCGAVNPDYLTTCTCGLRKKDNGLYLEQQAKK